MEDETMAKPTQAPTGPTTADGFLADRQSFWGGFTRAIVYVVVGLTVLLVGLDIFLV